MPAVVAARLLGAPVLTVDGAAPPPELLWRKHVALCLALWFAPGRRRSRDQLIGLLWGDKDEHAARHSLNEALRVIRRAAGDDVIDAEMDAVAWINPPVLDTDDFAALETTDPAAAAELVAGPFCDGLSVPDAPAFDQWLEEERQRWQHRMVLALSRAARQAEDRGDADAALRSAERGAALDPYSDIATQAVVRAHWLRGDRAAALGVGEAFRARLARDIGVEPDETTERLLTQVTRERRPRPPDRDSVPARARPLHGREAALDQLLTAWRVAVETSRSTLLVITGDAGCGRTRLLDEIIARAVLDGAATAILRAAAIDGEGEDAMWLGLAASGLAHARGVAAAAPAALFTLASRAPLWLERFPGATAPSALPLREALTEVALAAADEKPIMLAIDDAHRLHPDALRALPILLRSLAERRVAIVITVETNATTDATDELLRSAGRDIPGAVVRVEPLALSDLERLVQGGLGSWTPDARARLARRLLAESAGLPMIAVELLDAVVHGLPLESGAWPAPDRTFDATMPGPLPEALVAAIRLAFRRLPAESQALLQIAALMPEPVPADRLGRVAAINETARRDELLDPLEWEGWLAADGRGYTFPARAKRRIIAEEMLTGGQRKRLLDRISAVE